MKLIHAYIQPHKLDDVTLALHGQCGFSVSDVRGRGRGKQAREGEKQSADAWDFEKHMKLEICCPDGIAERIVETILTAAHTGLRGDGLICVVPVEAAIRISSGNRGDDAC